MMTFFGNIIVIILGGYLTFCNFVAEQTTIVFGLDTQPIAEDTIEEIPVVETPDSAITSLPSKYEYGSSLPDILIKNAAYQKATVIESGVISTTTVPNLEAVVNIYCTYRTDSYIRTTTGSGFFVNDNGVILTNAHVAQFLLLENLPEYGDTECIVRTGDIAEPTYKVALLYISPAWIQSNADLISQANPKGTGERDYALLYITEGIDNAPVPARLPALSVDTLPLTMRSKGANVTIAGYPAGQIATDGPSSDIILETASSSLVDLFTFGNNQADIFFLSGTKMGENGVSGGPVINDNGRVIGMISTRSDDEVLGAGSLNAITLSYVERTMKEETGFGFIDNTNGNLPYRAELFKSTIVPFLSQMLSAEL